jgi:two-component system response regulator TtrR
VDGKQSKTIAGVFDISQRTVEVHRANIMRKLEVKTIGELVRLALSARTTSDEESGVSLHSAEGA